MRGQRAGSLIVSVFGFLYLVVNSGPLGSPASAVLRLAGAAGFAAVLVLLWRGQAGASPLGPPRGAAAPFGRAYWLVVAGEVLAIFAGLAVLRGPLGRPDAGVAWVSVVVGLHFVPLAVVFRQPILHVLAGSLTACGVAGLALAWWGADVSPAAISAVAAVVPGGILLASSWWGARRGAPDRPERVLPGPAATRA